MKKTGFTLIELLLVISIISLMSSIIFASLSSARSKANDVSVIAQVRQYQNSFIIAEDSDGKLVDPGLHSFWFCLGKASTETCKFWGNTYNGSDALMNAGINLQSTMQQVKIGGLLYNDIVMKCSQIFIQGNFGECQGAIYWPQLSGTTCTKGKLVYSGSGGIICGQDIADTDIIYVENKPSGCQNC